MVIPCSIWDVLCSILHRQKEMAMKEEIRKHVAALNAAWRRYGRAVEQGIDSVPMDALNRDFLVALEGLESFGITERELRYDSETMTFSVPVTDELVLES